MPPVNPLVDLAVWDKHDAWGFGAVTTDADRILFDGDESFGTVEPEH